MASIAGGGGGYNVGALLASLNLNNAGFMRGMAAAEVSMKKFENTVATSSAKMNASFATVGASMSKIGRALSMYVTIPMAGAGLAAIKMEKDFERSLAKVEGLVGVAGDQVNAWRKDLLDMGKELGRGPKELADALYFVTSAGMRGAQAIETLRISTKGSVAGLGEVKVVADLLTSAINAYGKENLSAAQAGDILTATVREGKAESDALASSMGKVLPIAAEMGVSFAEVGAATAAMTRTGTTADIAATQLKAILNTLLKPSEQAHQALKKMGSSAQELRDTIKHDGLLEAMMQIREMTNKYGEEMMGKLFPNIRALMGILDIMGKNVEDNAKIFQSLQAATGSLDKAFTVSQQTIQNKFDKAMAALEGTLIRLGFILKDRLIPILERFTNWVDRLGTKWEGMSREQQKANLRIAGFVTVAGPALLILGKLIGLLGSFGPWGIAIAGAVGLGVALKRLTSERNKDIIALEKQRTEAYKLAGVLFDSQSTLEERTEAYKQLQEIHPSIVTGLDAESVSTQRLVGNLNSYNEGLIKKMALIGLEEQEQKLLGRQTEKSIRLSKAQSKLVEALVQNLTNLTTHANKAGNALPVEFYTKYQELINQVSNVSLDDPFNAGEFQKKYNELINIIAGPDADIASKIGLVSEYPGLISGQFDDLIDGIHVAHRSLSNFTDRNGDKIGDLRDGIAFLKQELQTFEIVDPGSPEFIGPMPFDYSSLFTQRPGPGPLTFPIDPNTTKFDQYIENLMNVVEVGNYLDKQLKRTGGAVQDFQDGIDAELAEAWFDALKTGFEKVKTIDPATYIEEQNKRIADSFNRTFNYEVVSALEGFAAAMGEAFVTGDASRFWKGLLSSLGSFAEKFGALILANGVAIEAFKKSLQSLNGIAAIITGIALIATGAAVKAFAARGPEGYAEGGIVPGNSYYGDKVPAFLNSGEMVLNAGQQSRLFGMINSPSAGGDGSWETANVSIGFDEMEIMLEKINKRKSYR